MNEAHRRHLAVSLRHAADLLDEAERILIASRSESPFRKYVSDLAPWQAGIVTDQIAAIRRKLAEAGQQLGLDTAGHAIDARHAIHVQASFAIVDVEEMHSRYLRGYGQLDAETARRVDALSDALENAIRELDRTLAVQPNESIEARIDRLTRSPVSPDILKTLDRLIARYHIPELRRPMAMLVERVEQRTFNIAVFGRVSSGKSSLLNALLGAPILPVGVTPITAVPTRIRFGDPAIVRVVYRDRQQETMTIDRLSDLASEESNPGNRRRVSLLQVRYPSPLLREGIEFVDTPGIGSLATAGAEETFAYLPRSDLAILLVDVGSAIGVDELSVLRLLQSAAIPMQIVLSKADLADEPSLRRMTTYIGETIASQTGLRPEVYAVSAMPSGESLLRRWIEHSIEPRLDKYEIMLEASIRRTTGAIRDAILMRLETLGKQHPSGTTEHIEERARSIVFDLRRFIDELSDDVARLSSGILRSAAAQLLESHDREWDARGVIASVAQRYLSDVRARLIERQRETKEQLLNLAASEGIAPELLQLQAATAELTNMPLLDLGVVLPPIQFRPPLFRGIDGVTKRLQSRFGTALQDALRAYANRLGDWAAASVDRVQASFTSALDSVHGDALTADIDLTSLDGDLQALREMAAEKEHV